jgi:hypothetical protein
MAGQSPNHPTEFALVGSRDLAHLAIAVAAPTYEYLIHNPIECHLYSWSPAQTAAHMPTLSHIQGLGMRATRRCLNGLTADLREVSPTGLLPGKSDICRRSNIESVGGSSRPALP